MVFIDLIELGELEPKALSMLSVEESGKFCEISVFSSSFMLPEEEIRSNLIPLDGAIATVSPLGESAGTSGPPCEIPGSKTSSSPSSKSGTIVITVIRLASLCSGMVSDS